jgi:hypothetical protein
VTKYKVVYGSEKVGEAHTKLGVKFIIWRFLRSKNNRYRQARAGNIRVKR